MNLERIKGVVLLIILGAIPGLFIFIHVKEYLTNRQERIKQQRIEANLQNFAKKHNAQNLKLLYENNLPKDKAFFETLTIEKQRAVTALQKAVTNQPVLFVGRIRDVRKDGDHYLLIMKYADFVLPFETYLNCPSKHVDFIRLQRKSFMDTFAVIVNISSVEEKPPTEESGIRFIFTGECIDIMYCGDD